MSGEPSTTDDGLSTVMERNVRALLERRRAEERERGWQERIAESITRFTGSMTFVCLHLVLFGAWIIANLPWVPWPKFDASYVILAMFASVEAIFLSTFVLITQNRMALVERKRAELDLQVSLLAEHEITRLVELVSAIAEKMNLEQARNPELGELKRDIAPEKVLETIERSGV